MPHAAKFAVPFGGSYLRYEDASERIAAYGGRSLRVRKEVWRAFRLGDHRRCEVRREPRGVLII